MPLAERPQGGGELGRYGIGLHRENPSDDPHRPAGIWTVQVAGLGRRKEWPGEHARRVGSEHQRQSPQAWVNQGHRAVFTESWIPGRAALARAALISTVAKRNASTDSPP